MRIVDISQSLNPRLKEWPGDTRFSYHLAWNRATGSSVNVGSVTMSTHFGTHVDAPFHFLDAGAKIDELALNLFIGPAVVIDLRGQTKITRSVLEQHEFHGAARVLLRTDAWDATTDFPTHIPVMDADVPDWLKSKGIVLLGIDLPSVDPIDSKDLPNHHALARNQIAILELVSLRDVAAGVYTLVALPLKIAGSDAAPVRAVLIESQPPLVT